MKIQSVSVRTLAWLLIVLLTAPPGVIAQQQPAFRERQDSYEGWEQLHHVAYRLDPYRAGTRLDYERTTSAGLAQAMKQALGTPVDYREVAPGAARRAAERIASLL